MITATVWATFAGDSEPAPELGDVERVQGLPGIRGDVRGAHGQAGLGEGDAELVQQPGTVLGAHLEHRRLVGGVRHHQRPGLPRRAGAGAARSVVRRTGGAGRACPSGARSPWASRVRPRTIRSLVGRLPARGLDVPLVGGEAVEGAQDRRAHDQPVCREQPGGVGEQSQPVAVEDVDAVAAALRADDDARLPRRRPPRGPRAVDAAPASTGAARLPLLGPAVDGRRGELAQQGRPASRSRPAGPAAQASASVRASSRSRTSRDPPTASRAAATVRGSWWSRRVARSMTVRCSRTRVVDDGDVLGAGSPCGSRRRVGERGAGGGVVVGAAHLADVVQQRGEQQQVGPADARARSPPAWTTVSTRCRSTVCRCTALRCGRLRTAAHSGSHRVDDAGLVEPLPDRAPARARWRAGRRRGRGRSAGHGVGQGRRAPSTRFARVAGAMRQAVAGGDHGRAQRQQRVGRRRRCAVRAPPRRRARRVRSRAGRAAAGAGPTRRVRARWDWPARRTRAVERRRRRSGRRSRRSSAGRRRRRGRAARPRRRGPRGRAGRGPGR